MSAVLDRPGSKKTVIAAGSRVLVGADGAVVELTPESYEAALNAAMGVMGEHRMITTGDAARLLDCSARTVARILDSGRLPFVRNGAAGRRMVDVVDVMDYRSEEMERMRESLASMRRAARDFNLNDDEMTDYVSQFDA
ncbi:helix-turn-helix domain-containing protein [Bifidobacterium catenulatum]|uniref:Excisionase n=1 Tax=Bifidobacterium catenulatum PV20-2 TaxID=1447716 RepID=A0A0A7I495_9BIFI|nr:helix-turn-helix domain-containing protein [Bifidobacterium catenulatum]AIZ15197.1 excisionase [Bifidobacterium catenulatum PV20-2]